MNVIEIQRILARECQISGGRPLVVGVSGGADSFCLMSMLAELKLEIIVAHFDHKLRPESGLDAQTVEKTAQNLGCKFVLGESDVRQLAKTERLSIEAAARHARYSFLFDQALRCDAEAVAVGHTADDQVETILLHLLRGSGLDGLKGMSYRTILDSFSTEIPLIRPLLGVWRNETVAYCREHALNPIEDVTNQDRRFRRNRLRHELIPILETYNPQAKKRLWTLGQVAQTSLVGSDELNEWIFQRCLKEEKKSAFVAFDGKLVSELPIEGLQNLIRVSVHRIQPETEELDYQSIQRAVGLIQRNEQTGKIDLGGNLQLTRVHGRIFIHTSDANLPVSQWPQFTSDDFMPLSIPGVTTLSEGWSIHAEIQKFEQGQKISENPAEAWLDFDSIDLPLVVRRWQSGDRIHPLGLDGTVKLSDLFINQKIPSHARKDWPLILCGEDIVWAAGLRISEKYRLKQHSRHAIHLQLIRN